MPFGTTAYPTSRFATRASTSHTAATTCKEHGMFDILKVRKNQGYQAIPDITKAVVRKPFRGLPLIDGSRCEKCSVCREVCPVGAISIKPLSIDLGKCVFCGDCERLCPDKSITF